MSPLMSVGLATTALAAKITARYRVHTDTAGAAQDGGVPPRAPVQRVVPSSGVPAQDSQSRGNTLDLSV